MSERPYSAACERNQEPIYQVLRKYLHGNETILELGSGTGQHAAYFAPQFPDLIWQPSDLRERHEGIQTWTSEISNIRNPIEIDFSRSEWFSKESGEEYDGVYTANTFHYVAKEKVENAISRIPKTIRPGGFIYIYGPFNEGGEYTSESNREFDRGFLSTIPGAGIRDLEWVQTQFQSAYCTLIKKHAMPANNQLLVFKREK